MYKQSNKLWTHSSLQGHVDHHHVAAGRGVREEARGPGEAGGEETQGQTDPETRNDTKIFRGEFTSKTLNDEY